MLTENFNKMLFILAGQQTGTNTAGESATMYKMNSSSGDDAVTLSYGPSESTWFFSDQLTSPDAQTLNITVDSRIVYNAFYVNGVRPNYTKNTLALLVGSGSTPATRQDYKLENQVILQSDRDFCNWVPSSSKITLCRQFINNTESPVIINEIGAYLISCAGYNTKNIFLIGRVVLTEPITIEVNDNYVFTYDIDMSNIITGV